MPLGDPGMVQSPGFGPGLFGFKARCVARYTRIE